MLLHRRDFVVLVPRRRGAVLDLELVVGARADRDLVRRRRVGGRRAALDGLDFEGGVGGEEVPVRSTKTFMLRVWHTRHEAYSCSPLTSVLSR